MWSVLQSLFRRSPLKRSVSAQTPVRSGSGSIDAPLDVDSLMATLAELNAADPQQITDMDIRVQRHFRRSMKPDSQVARHPELAQLLLFHFDGYTREAALDALDTSSLSRFGFLALCYRCNDWVEPIRVKALRRLEQALPQISGPAIQSTLPSLLTKIPTWRRYRHTRGRVEAQDATDLLDRILTAPNVQALVLDSLVEARTGPTSRLFQTLAKYPWIDPHLEMLCEHAHAAGVRRMAACALFNAEISWPTGRRQIKHPYGDPYAMPQWETTTQSRRITIAIDHDALFDRIARDRSAQVRAVAVDQLIIHGPDRFPPESWAHLRDDKRRRIQFRMHFFHRKWIDESLPDYLTTKPAS